LTNFINFFSLPKKMRATVFLCTLLLFSCARITDPFSASHNFTEILNSTGIALARYEADLHLISNKTEFSLGDTALILSRIRGTDRCEAARHYEEYLSQAITLEARALTLESLASLNCTDRFAELTEASEIWKELGLDWRADIDLHLAKNKPLNLSFDTHVISSSPRKIDSFTIGRSKLILDNKDILVSQAERVSRDWLSAQINDPVSDNLLSVFSEKYLLDKEHLMPDIGWHEGARIALLKQTGLTHLIATGTLAARKDGKWYAPNEHGVFIFEISEDKLEYPTTRYLAKELAMIIDTHGINMIVEQALRMNATAVIGCCDHPGKIAAADYLASKGIMVICPTDRFVPDLLFSDNTQYIIGSGPIMIVNGTAIIGDRPLEIYANEIVVASDQGSGQMYYDTPARYFKAIGWKNLYTVPIDDMHMHEIVKVAYAYNASVIGARVYFEDDYISLKRWLDEDENHRVVLFHSVSYPYGYKLFKEYPEQATFGDLNI
jgi:hypothetical protein